jgi:peptidoglycan/LPS O-acetylase OafA/YrhL
VLLVVLAHAGVGFLAGGFVGVDVFFVLSGFLITSLLLAEARRSGSVSLPEFYLRRARRILPAAALTLLVTDVAVYFLTNFVRAREAVDDSLHAAGFAANFHFAARGVDYFSRGDPPSPVLHYWSLSVEEQFYLVWPLLLSLALFGLAFRGRRATSGRERRLRWLVVALATASLAWSIHLTATAPTAAYFSPLTRAWELGLGAATAVCASMLARLPAALKVGLGWAGIAAIAAAALVFSGTTPFPGWAALLPTVGAACAIVAGMGERTPRLAVGRLLALRPMFMIGDRSYALYLWHWPVLILAADYAGHELSVASRLGLVVGAFLLSCLSYALVENPIRRRVRSRAKTGLVVLVCMAAFLGTAMASLAGIDREQQRFEGPVASAPVGPVGIHGPTSTAKGALPTVIAAVEAARRGAPVPSPLQPAIARLKGLGPVYLPGAACIGHDVSRVVATGICRVGDPSSRKLVVLLGDSHAMMWLPALLETAWHDHFAVVPLLRLGCTPGRWTATDDNGGCRAWFQWAVAQVERLHPQLTLLGGSIDQKQTPYARAAIEGLVGGAQELHRLGPVAVVGDPEGLDFQPVDCLLSRHASMRACTTTWPAGALAAYDEVRRRVTQLGAAFLATRGFVCFERSCPAVIGHTIAWADDNHMSTAYSARVAGAFRAALLRIDPAIAGR